MKIDILMPTYNRINYAVENLKRIESEIYTNGLESKVRLITSDNASSDGTYEALLSASTLQSTLVIKNDVNIGLENNVVNLLSASEAEYIMYISDDDTLPCGYIQRTIERIKKGVGVIVPNINAVYSDYEYRNIRGRGKDKYYKSSLISGIFYSYFCHQLSGLVFKREGLLSGYLKNNDNRNIYPFIYFCLSALENSEGLIFCKSECVNVTEGNSKDWRYNDIGLLDEIAKNYNSYYGKGSCKTTMAIINICLKQSWRLRPNSWSNVLTTIKEALVSGEFSYLTKVSILCLATLLFAYHSIPKRIK